MKISPKMRLMGVWVLFTALSALIGLVSWSMFFTFVTAIMILIGSGMLYSIRGKYEAAILAEVLRYDDHKIWRFVPLPICGYRHNGILIYLKLGLLLFIQVIILIGVLGYKHFGVIFPVLFGVVIIVLVMSLFLAMSWSRKRHERRVKEFEEKYVVNNLTTTPAVEKPE